MAINSPLPHPGVSGSVQQDLVMASTDGDGHLLEHVRTEVLSSGSSTVVVRMGVFSQMDTLHACSPLLGSASLCRSGLGSFGLMIIAVGSSLLLPAAPLCNGLGLGLGLGLRLLRSFFIGFGLRLDLLSTASLLGLLRGGLIIDLRLGLDLLGPSLLLGSLSFGGVFLVSFRLCLGLFGSSLCLGSFDGRSIFGVVGLLLGLALPGLLSGRSLSRLLLFFLASLLPATLLCRLLGRRIITILGTSALDCMTRWKGNTRTCSSPFSFSSSASAFFLVARPRMPVWPRTLYSGSPLKSSSAILPSIIAVRILA